MAEAKKRGIDIDGIVSQSNTTLETINGILQAVGINALGGKGGIARLDTSSQEKVDMPALKAYRARFRSIDPGVLEDSNKLMKFIDQTAEYNYNLREGSPVYSVRELKEALSAIHGITDYSQKGFQDSNTPFD